MNEACDGFQPTKRHWLGFWSMIVQQTQNAFNDKMAQFILIPLGGAVGYAVESEAGLLISLPFVLFAPVAGWLSDRYSKRTVLFASAVVQLVVLAGICAAVLMQQMVLALFGFFALAVQAAFFSPAKMGINKELVGSRHLGFATGIQQMTAMLAMLAGQIVAGRWFDERYHTLGGKPDVAWTAALGPLCLLAIVSIPALLFAWLIPRVPAQGKVAFTRELAWSHFKGLAELWADKPLRMASFGVAFFWGFAAYLNLWSVKLAKVLSHGGEGFGTLSSLFMAAASLGMALGFGFASWLLRRGVHLGWVPLAGLLMAVFSFALAVTPVGSQGEFLACVTGSPAGRLRAVAAAPECAVFLLLLGLLAFVSALFLAPLNAWMQDRYPAEKRGELQSSANLQDCLAGMVAVALISGLEWSAARLGVAPLAGLRPHMALIGIFCLVAALWVIRLLPADFVRLLGTTVVRLIYQIRSVHGSRVPAVGGVMILPNHVTFADAFFIATASRRPVRFVMDEAFIENRAIRVFTGIFETVTIRREQPLEAIRIVIQALKEGDLICLFPEGQLTRTGALSPLQRGFELIARKAGHPLVPMWCDGSWGSIFSFERGRYFKKRPHREVKRLIMAYGEALDPKQATLETVRWGMLRASADAMAHRFEDKRWAARAPSSRIHGAAAFRAIESKDRRGLWVNAHQIGQLDALHWHQPFFVLRDDPDLAGLLPVLAAFAELFGARPRVMEAFDGALGGTWLGGDLLRKWIQTSQLTAEIVFHDFGEKALKPVERAGLSHCAALAVDGRVISMSMPHPVAARDSFEPQAGHKLRARGKLLPGWYLETDEAGGCLARGPAAPGGLPLPGGVSLDAEGFVVYPEVPKRRFI